MGAPGTAFGAAVEQERLQAIESIGIASFGGDEGFEFVPQGAEFGSLFGGKEAEKAVGGAALALFLVGVCGGIVGEGVARVDLHNIVDEKHLHDSGNVDGARGILGEQRCHDREVPGMFGTVLQTALGAGDWRLAEDGFELVDFKDEVELLIESEHGCCYLNDFRTVCVRAISLLTFGIPIGMKTGLAFILFVFAFALCGCPTKPDSPANVRERAADTTAELKRDTKAIAQGVREGWTRDKSLDINSASREQLETLSGVTPKMAENIVSHRPYAKTSELTEKHIMSKAEYDKIADRLTAK